ncbi:uncharacterized protein DSM5745_07177 [Aspergillus mulundensis]|uniref:Uncharacterized protein n=1 Tax=Aspergillus mulundensis TaxID=1810919 RepID=A0A3D8RKE4_9EURO|nr:hypothetical protein DSM5745_07177 [Aspergillus mulundensis]RDW74515.1 hypothetical protein DSM5745_07177 [Aspergillus mulundensis]
MPAFSEDLCFPGFQSKDPKSSDISELSLDPNMCSSTYPNFPMSGIFTIGCFRCWSLECGSNTDSWILPTATFDTIHRSQYDQMKEDLITGTPKTAKPMVVSPNRSLNLEHAKVGKIMPIALGNVTEDMRSVSLHLVTLRHHGLTCDCTQLALPNIANNADQTSKTAH